MSTKNSPAKPILIITHSDQIPDNAVTRDLSAKGCELVWRRPFMGEALPEPRSIDGIVIFGGPQMVTEIADEPWMPAQIEWIADFVRAGGRTLGLCLGAQMIAHGLGGCVWRYPDETCEVGFYDIDPIGNEGGDLFGQAQAFYQFHLEGLDLPPGAVHLAANEKFPNQAFRWGDRCWAFQFHPEITHGMIQRWTSSVAENKPYIYERPNAQQPPEHFAGWDAHSDAVREWRSRFLDQWLEV